MSNGFEAERERLFIEIAELKDQREQLVRKLFECERENRELREELNQLRGKRCR